MFLSYFIFPFLLFIWYQIGDYLYYNINKKNFKLSRMHVSAIHATSVILSYLIGISGHLLMYWSTAYYVIDTIYEFINLYKPEKKINLYEFGIVIHHFISMFILSYIPHPNIGYHVYKSFFLAEVSNLPMYTVYHLQKVGYTNNYILKPTIFIEAMAFIICRLIICGQIAYEMFFRPDVPWSVWLASIGILIISAVWVGKLFKQIIQ